MGNVFELMAKLLLNTDEYDNKLNDSEKKSKSFGSKIGGALTKAGSVAAKGLAVAATASAAAVGKMVVDATKAYANYEQLVGGIETLFGAQGMSIEDYARSVGKTVDAVKSEYGKLQSAQDAVLKNASKAYVSAGLSANEYMETVTSFSASLINSLGGDTEKAAKMADKAIVDMSDNANKMGTSMESIQNAYQGFAKQNYTMLDNLKLGYGGTKEEMQRLLDDAGKLANQKFDISSYADVVEAIHVVQENMGIAGTTAKEAATTIQGSFGMMKSSWQNLVAGLGDKNADISQLITNFVDSASTLGQNVMPIVRQALEGIGQLVAEMVPAIMEQIPPLITETLPQLMDSGISMLQSIINGITENLPALLDLVIDIVDSLADMIIQNLPLLLEAGIQIITQLALGLAESLPTLIPTIIDAIILMVETLIDNVDLLIDGAIALVIGLAEGIIEALPRLIEKIPEIIEKLVTALIVNAPKLAVAALKLMVALAKGLVTCVVEVVKAIPGIIVAIKDGFIKGVSKIREVGGQFISGLWEGIKEKISWLMGKIKDFGNSVIGSVKGIFGIHSPSKVFAEIGGFLAEGLGEGWGDEIGTVKKEIESSMEFSVKPVDVKPIKTNDKAGKGIESMLQEYLPMMANTKIVLDTGVLVGETAPAMDNALGRRMHMQTRYA